MNKQVKIGDLVKRKYDNIKLLGIVTKKHIDNGWKNSVYYRVYWNGIDDKGEKYNYFGLENIDYLEILSQ